MGVLDDKVAIVTGAAAASAGRPRNCWPSTARRSSVNDLDGDVAKEAAALPTDGAPPPAT